MARETASMSALTKFSVTFWLVERDVGTTSSAEPSAEDAAWSALRGAAWSCGVTDEASRAIAMEVACRRRRESAVRSMITRSK